MICHLGQKKKEKNTTLLSSHRNKMWTCIQLPSYLVHISTPDANFEMSEEGMRFMNCFCSSFRSLLFTQWPLAWRQITLLVLMKGKQLGHLPQPDKQMWVNKWYTHNSLRNCYNGALQKKTNKVKWSRSDELNVEWTEKTPVVPSAEESCGQMLNQDLVFMRDHHTYRNWTDPSVLPPGGFR